MNFIRKLQLLAVFLFACRIAAQETGPQSVDGAVTLNVNRSSKVWSITVTNGGKEEISYEMLGKVPRGLGLEVWDTDENRGGIRIFAEDLAKYLNVDGFPADLREIAPGKSQVFQLDPRSMSAADAITLAEWDRLRSQGYYDCRVFFGGFASPLLKVAPPEQLGKREGSEPRWLSDVIKESAEEARSGIRLRRKLDDEGRSLVHWNRGSDREGEYYIDYTTCAKADFEKLSSWDGSKPLEVEIHDLVTRAQAIAVQRNAELRFSSLMIERCEDDPTKRYMALYFDCDGDEAIIELLMNGSPLKTTRLRLTEEQYEEFSKFGIPLLRQSIGGQSGASPESK